MSHKKRDLLTLQDLSTAEFNELLDLSATLKQDRWKFNDQLQGKAIGLVFQKPSNRTRVSFEVGIIQLGGYCLYLSPKEIRLGQRESTADVAKTLSRYLNGIVARTNKHEDVVELGKEASIPIINGLSDLYHPCQGLADIFSIKEKFNDLKGKTVAFVGDGNNVCHSLMLGCAKAGLNINIAAPQGFEPDDEIIKIANADAKATGSKITVTDSAKKAVKGAHAIYSDVFVSMGQEEESEERLSAFKEFQVNKELVKSADKDYIFLHCLPAHRGVEVTADIIDGTHSIVFDQAENRMHVQKAIMMFLLGNKSTK